MLVKGDVVLVPFPFTDLTQTKIRPAVVLWSSPSNMDTLLCFVTSQLSVPALPSDVLIEETEPEFASTGLRVSSRIRTLRMMSLDRGLVLRRLGTLGPQTLQQVNIVLKQALQL
ncbi:type II toxin-antitoxin system PemK/MazF family toxin [Gloeobacter morelensis]